MNQLFRQMTEGIEVAIDAAAFLANSSNIENEGPVSEVDNKNESEEQEVEDNGLHSDSKNVLIFDRGNGNGRSREVLAGNENVTGHSISALRLASKVHCDQQDQVFCSTSSQMDGIILSDMNGTNDQSDDDPPLDELER